MVEWLTRLLHSSGLPPLITIEFVRVFKQLSPIVLHSGVNILCRLLLPLMILAWGVGTWTPAVLNEYGFEYFDWKRYRHPSFFLKWIVVGVGAYYLKLVSTHLPPLSVPLLALMLVAAYGVFRADLSFKIIPDRFQVLGLLSAIGFMFSVHGFSQSEIVAARLGLAAALTAALWLLTKIFERCRQTEGMGMGDIKLLGWFAIFLGAQVGVVIVVGSVLALVVHLPRRLLFRRPTDAPFAFAPFLVVAFLIELSQIYIVF